MKLHISDIKASNNMVTTNGFAVFLFTYSLPSFLSVNLIGIIIKSEFKKSDLFERIT